MPETWGDEIDHRRKLAQTINLILVGKINNVDTVTLTANAATTTITDERIARNTIAILVPTTANAATALATTFTTTPNAVLGLLVVNHANNSETDRVFRVIFLG